MNLLRFKSPISRTQISLESGLNKATVTSLMAELLEDGFATEVGRGHSYGGRRPVLLRFNASAGYVIGIDLGVSDLKAMITDLSAHEVYTLTDQLPQNQDVHETIARISKAVQTCIKITPPSRHGVIGVGIGVPGLVDFETGNVINAPNLNWRDVPLKALVENLVQLPVYVDNEANVGALAEQLYGGGRGIQNFVYVSAGAGIGTGIITNGELYRGANGISGEFGHMTVEMQGLRCACGNRGCLEMYASEKALVERYRQLTGGTVSPEVILSRLDHEDPNAIESMHSVATYLAIGISNIVNGLNPTVVLIGNHLARAGRWLLPPIAQTLMSRCLIAPYSSVETRISSLGENAGVIGAVALAIDQYFARPVRSLRNNI